MALYHVKSVTIADGTNSNIVRPSDWVSAHSQVMTLAGNTAGASTVSGTNIVFQGGNNVTLSANQAANVATVVISAPTQTVQTQASGNIAGAGFSSATTAGTAVVATHNSAGLSMGVPAFITTYAAQTNQTQASGNIAGVGTTFAGANLSASMTLNSNGLNLSMSAAAPGGGGAINVSAGTTSGNVQTLQFDNANGVTFGLNGSTVTASVNAGGGGATKSRYFPHKDALWAVAQVGQNSIQVQPLNDAPAISYDRMAYGVQFSGATNSTMTVSATVYMGIYTKNGSTLSQLTSGSGSFSINGSGTANSTINSGPRWATMTLNAGGSFSGDVWIAFKSSTATAGVNATLSNIVASRINSTWSGYIGVGTAASQQSLPGMGYYSATSTALPNSMAFSHITGNSSTAQRPQVFWMTNGALPV